MFSIQAFYIDRDHKLFFVFTSTVIPPPHKNSQRKLLMVFLRHKLCKAQVIIISDFPDPFGTNSFFQVSDKIIKERVFIFIL